MIAIVFVVNTERYESRTQENFWLRHLPTPLTGRDANVCPAALKLIFDIEKDWHY